MEQNSETINSNNNITTNNTGRILRVAVGTTNPSKIKAVEQAMHRILSFHNNIDNHNNNNVGDNAAITIHVQGYNVPSNVADQPYNDPETKRGAMNRARNAYYYHHHHHHHHQNEDHITSDIPPDNHHHSSMQQQQQQQEEEEEVLLPHLGIGIEGGLEWVNDDYFNNETTLSNDHALTRPPTSTASTCTGSRQLYCMAWIAIYGRHNTPLMNQLFGVVLDESSTADTTTTIDATNEIFGLSKTAMFALPSSLSSLITERGMELGQADDVIFRRTNSKQASGTVGLLTNSMIDRSLYYDHAIQLAIIPWLHPNFYPRGHCQN